MTKRGDRRKAYEAVVAEAVARLRLEGVDVRAVARRISRSVRTQIDRERGRFLAEHLVR